MIDAKKLWGNAKRPQPLAPAATVKVVMTRDHFICAPGQYQAHATAGQKLEVPAAVAEKLILEGAAQRDLPMRDTMIGALWGTRR